MLSRLQLEVYQGAISESSACGSNLEDTHAFMQLEELIDAGLSVGADEETVDWRKAADLCCELLDNTRDVRVVIWLARALVSIDGLAGLSDTLKLLSVYITELEPDLHPLKDDDDPFPEAKYKALEGLSQFQSFIKPIYEIPIIEIPGFAQHTYKDWLIATGNYVAPDGYSDSAPSEQDVLNTLSHMPADNLAEHLKAVSDSLGFVNQIDGHLKSGEFSFDAPNFEPLVKALSGISGLLQRSTGEAEDAAEPEVTTSSESTSEGQGGALSLNASTSRRTTISDVLIGTSQEAEIAIDRVCDYFRKAEPSSPVPLLLTRAKTLINKDFEEILRDFAPSGMSDIEGLKPRSEDDY